MVTETCFSVRYVEVDHMGIVHHSNYPIWFETARRDFLRKAGTPNSMIYSLGFFLPLSEIKCEYKSPARFEDEIVVVTSIIYMSCVKIKFGYKVLNKKKGKILATGNTVHAWTNKSIRPVNIEKEAPEIYEKLKKIIEPTGAT